LATSNDLGAELKPFNMIVYVLGVGLLLPSAIVIGIWIGCGRLPVNYPKRDQVHRMLPPTPFNKFIVNLQGLVLPPPDDIGPNPLSFGNNLGLPLTSKPWEFPYCRSDPLKTRRRPAAGSPPSKLRPWKLAMPLTSSLSICKVWFFHRQTTSAQIRFPSVITWVDRLWKIAGELPEEGPGAPDAATYTIILNAVKFACSSTARRHRPKSAFLR
jgi:hypothetical protein